MDVGGSNLTAVHDTRHLLHGRPAEQNRGEKPPLDGRITLYGGKGEKRTRQDGRELKAILKGHKEIEITKLAKLYQINGNFMTPSPLHRILSIHYLPLDQSSKIRHFLTFNLRICVNFCRQLQSA
jgi:hypothetical protein